MTDDNNKDNYEAGIALRRKMWGEAGVERIEQASALNRPFEDLVTESVFGSLWQRPGLDLRLRSIVTLTALTALSKPNQLKMHIQGALANGVTVDEIREIIMHTSLYSGIPTGVEAMTAAKEVLGKLGLDS
ncbi:MAG: carboxymuconolactone decarboxylase family protein [Pseudomonadota bacterium]|nr:carboxymuconolactone decarboxylase family protein [Pseudomonadota bacterium]